MYFPEAKLYWCRRLTDAASKTPAFKGVLVTLEADVGANGTNGKAW